MTRPLGLALALALAFAAQLPTARPLGAQAEPVLVADLDDLPDVRGANESLLSSEESVEVGVGLFFLRVRSRPQSPLTLFLRHRLELWHTDGTAEGTALVRELPGSTDELRGAALPDGRLLFASGDSTFGEELWISDGTTAGTHLYDDLCPGACSSRPARHPSGLDLAALTRFLPFGPELLFAARREEGTRIFAASGGPEGARLVSELAPWDFALVAEELLILTSGDELFDPLQLWASDGTPGSERLVSELGPILPFFFASFRDAALLVGLRDSNGDDVPDRLVAFRLDAQGTSLLANVPTTSFGGAAVGENLAYLRYRSPNGECRLLRTDGTAAGSFVLVPSGAPGGECIDVMATVGDRLFFRHETELGIEPWTTDGTQMGTMLLADIATGATTSGPRWFTSAGGHAFFVAQDDSTMPALWRSDGTPGGTQRVREYEAVYGSRSEAKPLSSLGQLVVFAANDGTIGFEPWKSDGTPSGTNVIANLDADVGSSNPRGFVRRTGDLIFQTDIGGDPSEAETEWYRYEGEGSEPELVVSAPAGSSLGRTVSLAGDHVLVASPQGAPTSIHAVDPDTGASQEILDGFLFGAAARAGERTLVRMDKQLTSSILGLDRLWATDGTPGGTFQLLEAAGPQQLSLARFSSFSEELVWFTYIEPVSGAELWRSDGTPQGTRLALDLAPGSEWSGATPLAGTEDRLYLQAFLEGQSVLVTVDRSMQVLEILPFTGGFGAVGLRGRLLLAQQEDRQDPLSAVRLVITDGTAEAARTLRTFLSLGPITISRGLAFFAASTAEHGRELWVTDGTPEGTRIAADLAPGQEGSDPGGLQDLDGVLLFSARTVELGAEPFVTDGTAEGTVRLGDITPGPAGSDPSGFTPIAGQVVFAAERPDVGREPFAVERAPLRRPCLATEHTLCLGEGRFLVEVEWLDRATGDGGRAHAVPFRVDTGQFWFFDADNIELVVKVLDGTSLTDHHWLFYGALSDVAYWVTVVDTWTGHSRSYTNERGDICGVNDTRALPAAERLPIEPRSFRFVPHGQAAVTTGLGAVGVCNPATQLCLQDGRFAVEVEWSSQHSGGSAGVGTPIPGTADSGYFWFLDQDNVELAFKVIDARAINDRFWVYFGALTDVEYRLRVTDTSTGGVREYHNPEGTICGQADVDAFPP